MERITNKLGLPAICILPILLVLSRNAVECIPRVLHMGDALYNPVEYLTEEVSSY